ncbi:hypothetical protein AAHA92_06451 [Salvia divinorum]|uniref:PB1-like domain-containing protein n=1 Tax=Salvia divinorum TaxID=28513 RepID=A0ABD1I5P1_SALDI
MRSKDISIFNPKREYGNRIGVFTIALHHGGIFHDKKYIGGEVSYIDECTTKKFTLEDLTSIMLALQYHISYICEFYYIDPETNGYCDSREVGEPLMPLADCFDLAHFLSLVGDRHKLIYIYEKEVMKAEAMLKTKTAQEKCYEQFYKVKSSIVIEEIDEPEMPRPKPRPRSKWKAKQLRLEEADVEVLLQKFNAAANEISIQEEPSEAIHKRAETPTSEPTRAEKVTEDYMAFEIPSEAIHMIAEAPTL